MQSSDQYVRPLLFVAVGVLMATSAHVCVSAPANANRVLTVAADPNNLPFSNDREEGFENQLARLVANELHLELRTIWQAQRRGFFSDTLGSDRCDIVMGVPAGFKQCLTTVPYYRSTYVFVSREADRTRVKSFDDLTLKQLKIGVHTTGDGQMTPPGNVLIEKGLSQNMVTFSLYGDIRHQNAQTEIIRAVSGGKIDVAVAWGPLAGYFAAKESPPLKVTPIAAGGSTLPLAFAICIGVRKGEESLRDDINRILTAQQERIHQLLDDFHLPQLPLDDAPQTQESKE